MFVCSSNLPAKPAEEAQKHRQQYEEMVAQAKKRGKLIWQSHQGSLSIFFQSAGIHRSYKQEIPAVFKAG